MSSTCPVVLVVAVARNGVIGGGNRLLWRLPSDMRRFKALTMGKPMVMGRKTFESIGRALPGRETIVVTRDPGFRAEGVVVAHDVPAAIEAADAAARRLGAEEVMVVGGGDIYRQSLKLAERIELTEVDLAPDGDTYFPALDAGQWREESRVEHEAAAGDDAAFAFVTYRRSR